MRAHLSVLCVLILASSVCGQDSIGDQYTKFRRGDANGNGNLDYNDMIRMNLEGQRVAGQSDWSGAGPWTDGWGYPQDRWDVDDDGDIDFLDFTILITILSGQGNVPPPPIWPMCYDPTPDQVDGMSDYKASKMGVDAWVTNPYVYKQKYYGDATEFVPIDEDFDAGVLHYGFFNKRTGFLTGYGQTRKCQNFEHRTTVDVSSPTGTGVTNSDWTRALIENDDFEVHFRFDVQAEFIVGGTRFPGCSSGNSPQAVNELRLDTSTAKIVLYVKRADGIEKGVSFNFDELRQIGPDSNGKIRLKYRQKFIAEGATPPWFNGAGCYFYDLDDIVSGSGVSQSFCGAGGLTKKWPYDFTGQDWATVELVIPGSEFSDALGIGGTGEYSDWYLSQIRTYGINLMYHKYASEAADDNDSQRGDGYDDLACFISAEVKFRMLTVSDYAYGLTEQCP